MITRQRAQVLAKFSVPRILNQMTNMGIAKCSLAIRASIHYIKFMNYSNSTTYKTAIWLDHNNPNGLVMTAIVGLWRSYCRNNFTSQLRSDNASYNLLLQAQPLPFTESRAPNL
jgi:hypothetical protein